MTAFSLGKPTIIDGQEVIVVRDVVGNPHSRDSDVFAVVEPKGSDQRPAIYVSENDLTRMRESYPGIQVYGIWQILFYNREVKYGEPVIKFPLSNSGGMYLVMEAGADYHDPSKIVQSGEYFDNYIVDFIDYDLSKATTIDVDLSTLRLPPQPAFTRVELGDKIKADNNRRWIFVTGICSLILIAAFAVNYWLSTIHSSKLADYATKRSLIDELEVRMAVLSRERLAQRPDDSGAINQLFRVFEFVPDARTPEGSDVVTGFSAGHELVTGPDSRIDPASVVRGVTSELLPDLSYRLRIEPIEPGESADVQKEAN